MATTRIFCNVELEAALAWLRGRWNGNPGAQFRLFRNDLDPGPQSALADFVEANWIGYQEKLLMGTLPAPVKVADGHYETVTPLMVFSPPTAGIGNMVYGGYVTFGGAAVAAERFPAPITMGIGSVPFAVRLRVSTKSESLFVVG